MKTQIEESVIDTSKMSEGQRAALEVTESARDQTRGSFASDLFMGRFNAPRAFPAQSVEDRDQGDAFLEKLAGVLAGVDPDEIDRTGEIPQVVMDQLAAIGAFGIKVPPAYGGLGLSQTNYCRAGMLLGSFCGNLTALLSAHQSIGVSQPLLFFGTEEQKRKFLPRVAKGEISAFALTEPDAGSDPATMQTRAEPDGDSFVINGTKLWCTNGTRAGVIVVMARTPDRNGRRQITAFIVDINTPGLTIEHRCRFMGLKALYNAVITFKNVRAPRENILLEEGKGLRVALTTLNTGRLTLPAACAGLSKRCLAITRKWAGERVQWGSPIGKHAAIAGKIAGMAADTFAMEAMTFLTAALVDRHDSDLRVETAMCKLWATEKAWRIVDDTMQIRGGRGYETAASLKARGEEPVPVERLFRDSRINTIFEGSSEIMRLFIAREALDPHLKIGGVVLNSGAPVSQRVRAAAHALRFYAGWLPQQYLARDRATKGDPKFHRALERHVHYAEHTAHRLARTLFHAMAHYGPKLERQQVLLGRFVDIGAELFAITASCCRAQGLLDSGKADRRQVLPLVDHFCKTARIRAGHLFSDIRENADRQGYKLAQRVLEGGMSYLENGIVR